MVSAPCATAPPTETRTDGEGRLTVRGFFGDYEVSVNGRKALFAVQPGVPALPVTVG